MADFVKKYWKTLLFFALAGLVGGFFVGLYQLDSYPEEIRQEIAAQGIDSALLGIITAVQAAGYGLILGAAGILLGKKTGLWKDERKLEKKPLILTAIVAILGGMLLILSDLLFFGNYFDAIRESYAVKPGVTYILAAVVYGGVIEEVMLRLFFMSLLAFLLQKLFRKGSGTTGLLIAANLIAALLFAAAHLPATAMLMDLTPMILFRCFLLNGGLGLAFGWLYRKFGLRYAMLAHAGCHVISKLIWILFV
jgi:intracellular septation protein A